MLTKLTKRAVDAIKPGGKDAFAWDDRIVGFGLKVTPCGKKVYILQYRLGGAASSTRRYTIGEHGSPWTPDQARAEALKLRGMIVQGIDPGDLRRKKLDEAKPETFAAVATEFLDRYARTGIKPRTSAEAKRLIMVEVLPRWGGRPINTIRRRDVLDLHDAITDSGRPVLANRVVRTLRRLFSWAIEREVIESSPAARIRGTRETPRDRVLHEAELHAIWSGAAAMGWPYGPFVRLLILTAQRRDEVAGMRWSELSPDMILWTIPAERTKNSKAHEVPLSSAAREILRGLPQINEGDRVFSVSGARPITGYSGAKAKLDTLAGIEGWRFHDLRRTAATGMAAMGIAPHVVEKILNHVPSSIRGVAAIYNRHSYLDERRRALEAWAQYVKGLGQDDGDVLPLSGQAVWCRTDADVLRCVAVRRNS